MNDPLLVCMLDRLANQNEKIKTPAGEFDAFKVEYEGWWNNRTSRTSGKVKAVA